MSLAAPFIVVELGQTGHPAGVRRSLEQLLCLHWRDKALAAYRLSYNLALTQDSNGHSMRGVPITSVEAGQGIGRLLAVDGVTPRERAQMNAIAASLTNITNRPRAVTPIIVPLGPETSLAALLATHKRVTFDLAGDDGGARWPWVSPGAGILVWDPQGTGSITSGRQLFGSATWWIFWKDGYAALAALDDNHDGWLAGAELKGIRVWRDANGDGTCQPNEVASLASHHIAAIAARSTGTREGTLYNSRGVILDDGKQRPSYDWMPSPLPVISRPYNREPDMAF
jgi:hypothetical protein